MSYRNERFNLDQELQNSRVPARRAVKSVADFDLKFWKEDLGAEKLGAGFDMHI